MINLKLYDSQGKFKGLRKIIEEMRPILARMTDEQRNYILTTIFGSEQMRIITSLLGTSKEGFETLANSIYNSKGASEDFYNLQKDTPENKIKALASAWDNLKLHIGEAAAPAITGLIENLTDKIIELTDSDTFSKENVQAFFDVLIENLNTTLDILSSIATLLKPIIWGLKLVNKTGEIGKDIGSYLTTGKSYEQNLKEKEIIDNENRISQMNPQTIEDEKKRKKLFIENEKKKQEYWNKYGVITEQKAKYGDKKAKQSLVFKPISNDSEEVASIYDERYKYRKTKKDKNLDEKTTQIIDSKSIANGYKYVIKPPERQKSDLDKVSDKLGLKAPVSPLSTTFSPQVNVNMGGVVIKNEADIEKTAEMSKQKIMAELRNFVQITK